jgi:Apoptosis-inducing factor, mitochondrion-associated, C-term
MAGGDARYGLQSMFWSDLENIGVSFQAVGRVEHGLETVAAWNLSAPAYELAPSANKYTEGVVWYLQDKRIVGAVLWNLHGQKPLAAARMAIASKLRIEDDRKATAIVELPDSEHKTIVRTEAEVDPFL